MCLHIPGVSPCGLTAYGNINVLDCKSGRPNRYAKSGHEHFTRTYESRDSGTIVRFSEKRTSDSSIAVWYFPLLTHVAINLPTPLYGVIRTLVSRTVCDIFRRFLVGMSFVDEIKSPTVIFSFKVFMLDLIFAVDPIFNIVNIGSANKRWH